MGVVWSRPRMPLKNDLIHLDPTTAPIPALQSRDKGALRVNPEQAPAFRPESRRVDLLNGIRIAPWINLMG
jgi:hypothetical protein